MTQNRDKKGQFAKGKSKKPTKKVAPKKASLTIGNKHYDATQKLISSVNAACQSYLKSISA